jgi:hypothetical protein
LCSSALALLPSCFGSLTSKAGTRTPRCSTSITFPAHIASSSIGSRFYQLFFYLKSALTVCSSKRQSLQLTYGLDFLSIQAYRLWMERKSREKVKKHLSQGFLALIAFYHNTRPLPHRGNKTPLELAGVDLGDDDWVRLIEHEMRYGQAAAVQKN